MSIMSDDEFVRLFQRTFGLTEDAGAGRVRKPKCASSRGWQSSQFRHCLQ